MQLGELLAREQRARHMGLSQVIHPALCDSCSSVHGLTASACKLIGPFIFVCRAWPKVDGGWLLRACIRREQGCVQAREAIRFLRLGYVRFE